jgi:4-carboxymuconolactone decarboxylase
MARTPTVTRDQVPEKYREVFDSEVAISRNAMENGPGSVMINSPEMRKRANHLVFYFREQSELPQNIQEMAMIMTARDKDCQYIWFAHAARAREQGISNDFVDALRDKKPLPKLQGAEQIVVDYATELFATNRVSEATFKTALDHFGALLLTELTTMMGYYSMLALNVNAFEVDVPTGGEAPLVV